MTAFLDRLRSNPVVVDVLLALGLTALSLVPLLSGASDVESLHPVSVALLLLQTLPLAFRRAQPVPVLVVTGVATVVQRGSLLCRYVGWVEWSSRRPLPALQKGVRR